MMNAKNIVSIGLICAAGFLPVGCMDITGRGPAPLAKTITTEDEHPRVGHVYCMRGWLGIFSTGMDQLAQQVNKEVAAVSVADEEWLRLQGFLKEEKKAGRLNGPLVLVGHSWGADDQIRVAEDLKQAGITVDLLLVVDPVTPPAIPDNIKKVVCIYKSHPASDSIPFWRGVPIDPKTAKAPVTNINLREAPVGFDTTLIDHVNIEKSEGVHQMVLAEIRKVCPERALGMGRDGLTPEIPTWNVMPQPSAAVAPPDDHVYPLRNQ